MEDDDDQTDMRNLSVKPELYKHFILSVPKASEDVDEEVKVCFFLANGSLQVGTL